MARVITFLIGYAAIVLGLILVMVLNLKAEAGVDVSLGSQIGGVKQPQPGQLPFWAELYGQYEDIIYGVGHRSNADYDGNETSYEYIFLGSEFTYDRYYFRPESQYALTGDLKNNSIFSLETGVKENAFRFGAYYESGEGLNIHGLKFGYTFE